MELELESILLPGIEEKRPLVIAGPCSAETEEQVMDTAKQLAATTSATPPPKSWRITPLAGSSTVDATMARW